MKEFLWAKSAPKKSLCAHLIDTGVCAQLYLSAESSRAIREALAENWNCTEQEAIGQAAYIAALHDIGKAHPDFQRKDQGCLKKWCDAGYKQLFEQRQDVRFRHEQYSATVIERILKSRGFSRSIAKQYAAIAAIHHQGHESVRLSDPRSSAWMDMQDALEEDMRTLFIQNGTLHSARHWDSLCMTLAGVTILCDWVASSDAFSITDESTDYYASVHALAGRVLNEYGLVSEQKFPEIDSFSQMWPRITTPRPLQKCSENLDFCAPLTIIEAPMGEGKTEAALYVAAKQCAAYGKRGLYMALPTQATSNQMVGRVSAMFCDLGLNAAKLMHGLSWLVQSEQTQMQQILPNEDAAVWLRPLRMGMLGRSAVGTVDQAMASVLRIKYSMLRLLGLTNKVLVIDEIHAYDMYMSRIISRMLEWCSALKIPVILISATMQRRQKEQYLACFDGICTSFSQAYPAITQIGTDGHIREYRVESGFVSRYMFLPVPGLGHIEEIADRAINKAKGGGCVCVMLNTVRQAQAVYSELKNRDNNGTDIILFHARFTVNRRQEIEKICLDMFGKEAQESRPSKAILVCTQVVEQSLDVDFDMMITEIAPVDLLLQRAGRVHRHRFRHRNAEFEQPVIEVLVPSENTPKDPEKRFGTTGYVYDPFLLENTEKLIAEMGEVHIPGDVRRLVDQCYENITDENIEAFIRRQTGQAYLRNEADSVVFSHPDPNVFFPTQTHPRFEIPEADDGYETIHASTRLGQETVRLCFAGDSLFKKAQTDYYDEEIAKRIMLSSVALTLPKDAMTDLGEKSDDFMVLDKGRMRGTVLIRSQREATIGKYRLIADDELGITVE